MLSMIFLATSRAPDHRPTAPLALAVMVATVLSACGGHGSAGSADGGRDVAIGEPGAGEANDDVGAQDDAGPVTGGTAALTRRWVSAARTACEFSSPLAVSSRGQIQILTVTADGTFTAVDPATGADVWKVTLSAPAGLSPHLVAPPVAVGTSLLVFAWQDVSPNWTRMNHHVGVLDLEARAVDPAFPAVTLSARKPAFGGAGTIDFVSSHAYSRSALAHARVPGRELGLVYVSFGNVRDLQPWHGWVFELDLDDWKGQGAAAAVTASLVTTAVDDCGPENGDGARQMVCGGGVWSHFGPQVVYDDQAIDGFQLLVATGNGALDPTRGEFANAVLRTGRGLGFDAACDPLLCDSFDVLSPSEACMDSCRNLFMPRLLPGQSVPEGANRVCVGRTLMGCYAALDWDLGASAPAVAALPGGPIVVVQPGKDGSVYLMDARNLGTMFDRAPIMVGCGEGGGRCNAGWAGTMVTQPAVVTVGGVVLALVPTFVQDDVHPAGLQALEISTAGGSPRLLSRWQAPSFATAESITAFRNHAGGVTVFDVAGEPFAAIVATAAPGQAGTLYLVRVRDGVIQQRVALTGPGQRFARPLARDGMLYVPSCDHTGTPNYNEGPSHLEAFSVSAR